MKTWFVVLVTLIVAITALSLVMHPADVTVAVGDFQVSSSLYVVGLAVILLVFSAGLILRFVFLLFNLPAQLSKLFQRRKQKKDEQNFIKGIQLYLEGDYGKATQVLTDYAKSASEAHPIVYLLAADAALLNNEPQSARKLSAQSGNFLETDVTTDMIAADIAVSHESPESVAIRIDSLLAQKPGNLRAVRTLIRLCEKSSAWHLGEPALWQLDRALQDMPHRREQIRIKIISALLNKAAKQKDRQQFDQLWKVATDNNIDGALLDKYIPLLVQISDTKEAERYLEKIIEENNNKYAVEQYGRLVGGDARHRIQRVHQWLEQHPSDSALLLCVARLYQADGQPAKAKEYLEKSLAVEANYEAWYELQNLSYKISS